MATTNFVNRQTPIMAEWLNDVDDIAYRKAAETISVKDVAYGAVGDGTTDDAVAIQKAIDAVAAAGGGILWFPKATYKITTALALKTGVTLELGGSTITQTTSNTPVLTAPSAAIIQKWKVQNGILEFSTQQTSSDTAGVGIRLANGASSYDFVIKDVQVNYACDGIYCPNSASSFAFVGQIENFIGYKCAVWSINISCDTATGANTNLVFTNCWALQESGAEISTSSGFRFVACSMSQWNSLYADHIVNACIYAESCSGVWGVLTLESAVCAKSSGQLSLFTFNEVSGRIASIKLVDNSLTTTSTGEIYVLRPTTAGTSALHIDVFVMQNTTYSGTAIYEYAISGSVSLVGNRVVLDRTPQYSGTAVNWNGVYSSPPAFQFAGTGTSYANDAAAQAGGIAVGQLYRNGSTIQIRVV